MKRKDFLNSACLLGLCTCVGMPMLASTKAFSKLGDAQQKEDGRLGFMRKRFAKLWDIINSKVPAEERDKIVEALGRECAKENKDFYLKYKDNVEGFLAEIKTRWIESADYNKDEKTIRLVGKKTGSCGCPFVDKSIMSKEFCKCSIGYQKEVYGIILGRQIESEITESVLYGGEKCSFLIHIS